MAPLTKEEKKAKKEAAKLEKMRLEEEARKQLRRDELSRELAAQALRRGELDKSWREVMMRIKEPIFKKEVEIMWHVFERYYDKKDFLVGHLMRLIETADDQFQRTISAFCDMIDTMINKFLIDLDNLSIDNDRRTKALMKWGNNIRDRLAKDDNAAELHLQILLYFGHSTHDSYSWNTKGEMMVKEDEEFNNYLDIRDNLTSFLENTYIKMWDEYKLVLKTYVQGTAENQKNVRRLRRKENVMADIIASQAKKLANSDKMLARLRHELVMYESGEKQAAFRERRNRHRAAALRMKQRLIGGLAVDERRMATLVRCSNELTDWMKAVQEKGVKIIRLAALCRRYETQREKVLPFGSEGPPVEPENKGPVRQKHSDDSLLSVVMSTTAGLQRLWARVAHADLGRRALIREKMILEHENEIMMSRLGDEDSGAMVLQGTHCTCVADWKKTEIVKPCAVNGTLEAAKYKKYYSSR